MNPVSIPRLAATTLEFQAGSAEAGPPDLVTVAVSLYNYGQFLEDCLDTLLTQKHPSLELIVVDDCSTQPESLEAALRWLERHGTAFHQARLLKHVRNQGLAEARNTAFEVALGDLIFVLDADNQIYPRAISRLYQAMQSGEYGAAYTQLEIFGAVKNVGVADVFDPSGFVKILNYIDAMAMVRKSTWSEVGGYKHIEGGWEDFDFWLKMVEHHLEAAFIPEILCRYRVHPDSMVRQQTLTDLEELKQKLTLRHPWLVGK